MRAYVPIAGSPYPQFPPKPNPFLCFSSQDILSFSLLNRTDRGKSYEDSALTVQVVLVLRRRDWVGLWYQKMWIYQDIQDWGDLKLTERRSCIHFFNPFCILRLLCQLYPCLRSTLSKSLGRTEKSRHLKTLHSFSQTSSCCLWRSLSPVSAVVYCQWDNWQSFFLL